MKKCALWISVALPTFSFGVTCTLFWLPDYRSRGQNASAPTAGTPASSESELLELSFCQIVAKPEEYEGKVIRIRAVYSFGIHGATIGDRSCSGGETGTWVSVTQAMWDELTRATEKAYGMKNVAGPIDMVAVGRFERNNPSFASDTWADRLPFRFELMQIENAVRLY